MPRNYDIVKAVQDLTYLDWTESSVPTGAPGARAKAREGTGAHSVIYKLPAVPSFRGEVNHDCLSELLSSRIMRLLGIDHVSVTLVRARVRVDDVEQTTWLTKTKNYRRPGQQKTSLQQAFDTMALPSETPFEFCVRNGWAQQSSALFLADYLTANRSRTGLDVEVLRHADGSLHLAPLLASSQSLVSSFPMDFWRAQPLAPIKAECFLGSSDLEQNLRMMDPAFECRGLTSADRRALLAGLRDVASSRYLNGSWVVAWKRWNRYQELRKEWGR